MAKKGISAHFKSEAIIMIVFFLLPILIAVFIGFLAPMILKNKEKTEINALNQQVLPV